LPQLEIRPIETGDGVKSLSLGDEKFAPLKTFLQKHAKDYEVATLARTYVAVEPDLNSKPQIRGYITLVAGEIVTDGAAPLIETPAYAYSQYPAVKIARLAVHKDYRGSGLGRELVDLALGITKSYICPRVGCRFVVVDAKRCSIPFYDRCGFTLLDTRTNKRRSEPVMFVDLNKIPV